jgi:hypothetical protein
LFFIFHVPTSAGVLNVVWNKVTGSTNLLIYSSSP